MQAPRHPGGVWGSLLGSLLRWVVYGMLLSVMVLVGSAVLRRAAATQSAAANGVSGMAAAPSLPGPGSSAGYAPKEYIKVSADAMQNCTLLMHALDLCSITQVRKYGDDEAALPGPS